jgi:hypothetical protein
MGKLTGRSAISSNIDGNLLIHVVDTTGTDTSFKATLSQLYGIFPKNSSAGAGDVNKVPKWTATNELGASIIEDDGSLVTIGGDGRINGKLIIEDGGSTHLEFHRDGECLIEFKDSTGATRKGLIAQTSANTSMLIQQGGNNAIEIDNSGNTDIKESIQIRQTSGTAPVAGQYLKATDTDGNAEWADVVGGVQASGTPVNNQIAVWTNGTTIEGVSTFTYDSGTTSFKVSSPTDDDYSEFTNNGITQVRSTDDANLSLICYGDQSKAAETQSFKYRGSFGAEVALQTDDLIASHRHIGYDGSGVNTSLYTKTFAAENWTGSAAGVYHVIDTCAIGETTATERFRIDSDGSSKFTNQVYSSIASTVTPASLAATINWNNGNMQVLDMTSNVNTLTLSNPKAGASYFIKIIQSIGGATITWPAAVKWAENDTYVGSAGAGDIDAVALTYDGTSYLANYSLDYQ